MIWDLVRDSWSVLLDQVRSFWLRRPPLHYAQGGLPGMAPVVFIPGLTQSWHSMQAMADALSRVGHPVYLLPELGRNLKPIHETAQTVQQFISGKNLENVIIVGHSKGGLIGKYLLSFLNADCRLKKVIALATPFHGSNHARIFPFAFHGELRPGSKLIQKLQGISEVNRNIFSIFGTFDGHIRPLESCHLEGAKNIQVPARGHHLILRDPKVIEAVLAEAAD